MRQCHRAPRVRGPTSLRGKVRGNDLLIQVGGHGTGARILVDGATDYRADETLWKTWRRTMLKSSPSRIDQHDAAVTSGGDFFDQVTQRLQDRWRRLAGRHHFQQALLSFKQRFRLLLIIDVSVQQIPENDLLILVSQRVAAHVKPAMYAVCSTQACLKIIGAG